MNLLEQIKTRALEGEPCSIKDALEISKQFDINDICDAADEIRQKWSGDTMDTCSIVNARSGRCSEDCKWCAQSRFHKTGCKEYDIIPHDEVMKAVELNTSKGVRRFSLVTSGRKVGALTAQSQTFMRSKQNRRRYSKGQIIYDSRKRTKAR